MNSLIQWIHLIESIPRNSFILWTHGFTEFIYIQETSNDITVTDNGTEERNNEDEIEEVMASAFVVYS